MCLPAKPSAHHKSAHQSCLTCVYLLWGGLILGVGTGLLKKGVERVRLGLRDDGNGGAEINI